MCSSCNKISGKMKTSNLSKSAINYVTALAGAAAAQEAGKMVPATSLDPMYTDVAKVAIGGLLIPMVTKNAYAHTFGLGFALQGGMNLVNQYLLAPSTTAVSGYDNRGYAVMGVDNRDYALMGTMPQQAGSQPVANGSLAL